MKKILIAFALFAGAIPSLAQFPVAITPLQVFDARTGQSLPCVGCQIFTYEAGTNTPLAAYTDASLDTPLSNPACTNSAGYVVGAGCASSTVTGMWVGNACYKIVTKTAEGVTLTTQDNVCDPYGYLLAQLAAAGGAGLVGYQSPVAGTIPQTVAEVLNQGLSWSSFCAAGETDNGPCINSAIATVDALNLGRITCFGTFNYSTPISATLTNNVAITSSGASSCKLNYTGLAIANGGAATFNSPNQTSQLEIGRITFSSTNAVDVLLDMAGVTNSSIHDNVLKPAVGTGTCMRFRGTQHAEILHNDIQYLCGQGLTFLDQLEGPAINPLASTITSGIASSGGGTFTIASSAMCTQIGVNVSSFSYVKVDNEMIQANCTTTTVTIRESCGVTGDQPCRAQQGTIAVAHSNGAVITDDWSFPPDQINVTSNIIYGINCAVCLLGSGRQNYTANKMFEAQYGITNINGLINLLGGNQAENSPGNPGIAAYYQNKQGQTFGSAGPVLWNMGYNLLESGPWLIKTGTAKITSGVIVVPITMTSSVFSSSITNTQISGAITNASPDLIFCGNYDSFGLSITTLYSMGCTGGPFGPISSASGPPVTIGLGKATGQGTTAATIRMQTLGTLGGRTAIAMSGATFAGSNSFAASADFCTTIGCATGDISVTGSAVTWTSGSLFQTTADPFPWVGATLFWGGSGHLVTAVADSTHLTLSAPPGDGSYAYNTYYGQFTGARGGTVTLKNQASAPAQNDYACFDSDGNLYHSHTPCV